MWKVLVVICTLGNPCNLFEQDPMVYYSSEKQCIAAAEAKSKALVKAFHAFGSFRNSSPRCASLFKKFAHYLFTLRQGLFKQTNLLRIFPLGSTT